MDSTELDYPIEKINGETSLMQSTDDQYHKSSLKEDAYTDMQRQPRGLKYLTAEPQAIGAMFIVILSNILSKEYIHQRIADSYDFALNESTAQSCSVVKDNASDPYYVLERQVSSESAAWILYLNVASEFLIFSSLRHLKLSSTIFQSRAYLTILRAASLFSVKFP